MDIGRAVLVNSLRPRIGDHNVTNMKGDLLKTFKQRRRQSCSCHVGEGSLSTDERCTRSNTCVEQRQLNESREPTFSESGLNTGIAASKIAHCLDK